MRMKTIVCVLVLVLVATCTFAADTETEKKKRPVVLFSSPGSHSHVVIILEFALAFDRLYGDEFESVVLLTAHYGQMVESRGLRAISVSAEPFSTVELSRLQSQTVSVSEQFRNAAPVFASSYRNMYNGTLKAFDDENPVFVVNDFFTLAAMDIASERGVPFAVVGPLGFGGFEDEFVFPDFLSRCELGEMHLFWTRFMAVVAKLRSARVIATMMIELNAVRANFGHADAVSIGGYWHDRLVFAPLPFGFEFARDTSPLVHSIGFVSESQPRALEERDRALLEWLDALDERERVVYVAFGSHAHLMPWQVDAIVRGALAVAPSVRVVIVLRADTELTLADELVATGRVRVESWVHQRHVLAHRRVAAFVTHGGLTSLAETVEGGTAVLCVPLFGDQPGNGVRALHAGIGEHLPRKEALSADQVEQKLRAIIVEQPTRYLDAVHRLREANRYSGGTRRAAELTRMAIDIGIDHLRPVPLQFSLVARHNLDVFATLAIVVIALLYAIYRAIRAMCCCCCRRSKKLKVV
jgi:UDP-glucoronosyl and UDP-glucosyl transferase